MLGQRLSARATRHQRLARRLRARHALFERRDAVPRLQVRGGRGRGRVRFLRPIARTPTALAAVESPPDEQLAMAESAFVAEAPLAAPEIVAVATDEEDVPAAHVAAPEAEPQRARATAPPPAPLVETRRAAVEAQLVDADLDAGSDDGVDEPLPQHDATPAAPWQETPSEPPSAALPELPTQATTTESDAGDAPVVSSARSAPVIQPSVPAEQRVARPPARRGERAALEAASARDLIAPQPDVQPAGEPAELAEATEMAAEPPAELHARSSEPALSPPPEPLDVEALFAPRAPDERAPTTWLERLTRAAEGDRAPAPAVAPSIAQPTAARTMPGSGPAAVNKPGQGVDAPDTIVLPPSARRFLRPLVGVEPDAVPLRAGPAADAAVAAQAADALAFEGEVVLGAEAARTLDAPRTLGLLAHELTHVARRSAPRFVPPVARDRDAGPPPTDEEALATRVEAHVTRAAERGVDGSSLAAPNEFVAPRAGLRAVRTLGTPPRPSLTFGSPGNPAPSEPSTQGVARQQPPSVAEPFDFGGLPAPWEPFPSWITDTFAPAPSLSAAATAALPLSGLTAQPPATTAPLVQRAGEERSLEPPKATPDAAPAHTAAPHATPPDLDELARQVYGILRRRLAAEARRAG